MTDRLYTDDDLRAEAASLLAGAARDADDRIRPAAQRKWGAQASPEAIDEACDELVSLLDRAADVSEWAVNLGADGLEPEEHQFTLSAGPRPVIRVHFAFAPELSDDARTAFVEGLGTAAAREMQLALTETAEVDIPLEVAAHVLWQERLGGWPPSTFSTKLLDLWTSADTDNADRLAVAFPAYAAAIALVKSGQPGIQQLRAISGDD